MRRTRRNTAAGFKAKVALAAMRGDTTQAEMAEHFDYLTFIRTRFRSGSSHCWSPLPICLTVHAKTQDPDLRVLHVKIGQLTLENEFLEGALTKAGLLSARR